MSSVLKISSPDELIAFVPHALRFTPQGMVCLPLGGGPTARLDIPRSPNEMDGFLRSLSDVYLRQDHPRQVALLAYGEDGRSCGHALAALGEALAGSEGPGPDVGPLLWVNGEQWMDVLTGTHGIVHPECPCTDGRQLVYVPAGGATGRQRLVLVPTTSSSLLRCPGTRG